MHPGGSRNIPSCFMLQKLQVKESSFNMIRGLGGEEEKILRGALTIYNF